MYSSTLAVTACIFSTNFAQIEAGVEDVADMLNSVVVVCLLSTGLVQVDAGVGDVLRESMMVNEKNPKNYQKLKLNYNFAYTNKFIFLIYHRNTF